MASAPDPSASLPPQLRASLCLACRFHRLIESGRGSQFLLCGRAQLEPWFSKYPPQPQRACLGFEPKPGS